MEKKIIIAIDGYAACGKSTTAKEVARRLAYVFIDSGAMYRAVTLFFLENDVKIEEGHTDVKAALEQIELEFRLNPNSGRPDMYLNGENVEQDIREMRISSQVSAVAALPSVRHALVAQQQRMGLKKGIVMDGRDIGTVVFPEAELKIFMTASIERRIQRRRDEMRAKGLNPTDVEIRHNLEERDRIDSTRKESPLRRAEDALLLDNTDLSIDEQVNFVVKKAEEIIQSPTIGA